MHLAYLQQTEEELKQQQHSRRDLLKKMGGGLFAAGMLPGLAFGDATNPFVAGPNQGFKGKGRMGMSTGEEWIDTFFTGGAKEIIHYYADDFVFEDITLFQTITDKETLYRAFLPFNDEGPDSPAGVHHFDIVRYDGGMAGDRTQIARPQKPDNYTEEEWETWSQDALLGLDFDYDEWGVMNWVWRAKHNMDEFLGIKGTKGKTTYTRGITFHMYKNRKVVREYTFWNFRGVAVQLGAIEPPFKFWLPDAQPPATGA